MEDKKTQLAKFLAEIYGGGWEYLTERAKDNYLKDAQRILDFAEMSK